MYAVWERVLEIIGCGNAVRYGGMASLLACEKVNGT